MKKLLKILAIALATLLGAFALFLFLGYRMVDHIQTAYNGIETLELQNIPDGTYVGKAGELICSVNLNVTMENGRITDIDILRQVCGSDYKGLEVIPRILETQSAKVDAVSGATMSSKSIMAAVYEALGNA